MEKEGEMIRDDFTRISRLRSIERAVKISDHNRRKSGQDVGLSRGISLRWPTTRLLSPRNCALPAPCERSVSSSCVTSTKASCSRTAKQCVWPRPWAERKSDSLRHSNFRAAQNRRFSLIIFQGITDRSNDYLSPIDFTYKILGRRYSLIYLL